MAIIFMDGMDLYNSGADWITGTGWSRNSAVVAYGSTLGRYGGGGFTTDDNASIYAEIGLTGVVQGDTIFLAFACKHDGLGGSGSLIQFRNTVNLGVLNLTASSGSLSFTPQAGSVINGSGTPMTSGVWHWVEIMITFGTGAANGAIEVRVDGITDISATGIDTHNAADPTAIRFTSNPNFPYFDDVILYDDSGAAPTTFTGDSRIDTIRPTADGFVSDWTASAGADFECVDDANNAADDDTTYISSATPTQKSSFALSNLTGTTTTINAVQTRVRARKTDAGATTYRAFLYSDATEASGLTVSPAETYAWMRNGIFNVDPDGSIAWADAGVNALEMGVELVS